MCLYVCLFDTMVKSRIGFSIAGFRGALLLITRYSRRVNYMLYFILI